MRSKLGELTGAARELSYLAQRAQSRGKHGLSLQAWRESARLFARVRQTDHALWAWTSLERLWQRLPPKQRELAPLGAEAAAEAHLAIGQRAFEEFTKQPIKPPLQLTLQRKVSLLKRVRKRDEETVAMRQAGPAVCALVQLGEAQLSMSQAIERSPTPSGLRGEQRKLYRETLAEQWKPILQSAEETLLEFLRPRQLLLVLDNCEHLLAACASPPCGTAHREYWRRRAPSAGTQRRCCA